jgi:hypothetical protein
MASNDSSKCKLEEEVESLMARKRLWLSDDDGGDDDSSDSLNDEAKKEEEVSSEESSMKVDTSEDKLLAKHDRVMIFSSDGDTSSPSSEPRTLESHRCSDEDNNDEDDNDNDF